MSGTPVEVMVTNGPLVRKSFLSRLFETLGLSLASFLFVYALGRLFQKSLGSDSMFFLLPRPSLRPPFKLEDHWAGGLPDQAQEVIDMFLYPEVYEHFGSHLPKGVLLYGLPGTGKTHFARVIAEMTGSSFLYAAASQFDEVFVGKGAQRVRALFDTAQNMTTPSWREELAARISGRPLPPKRVVVFIDELDAIGTRGQLGGLNSTTHATVSQLLTCLDGLADRGGSGRVFVIAATNSLEHLDPALRRSGRFDRAIEMPLPSEASRLALLRFALKGRPGLPALESSGALQRVAVWSEGFAAADMRNLVTEGLMRAVRGTIARTKEGDKEEAPAHLEEHHLLHGLRVVFTKLQRERKDMAARRLPMEAQEVEGWQDAPDVD